MSESGGRRAREALKHLAVEKKTSAVSETNV